MDGWVGRIDFKANLSQSWSWSLAELGKNSTLLHTKAWFQKKLVEFSTKGLSTVFTGEKNTLKQYQEI